MTFKLIILILSIFSIFSIYMIYDKQSNTEYQEKYILEQAKSDSLIKENGAFKKLATPIMSNEELSLLESKFDGLKDELNVTKGKLILATETTLKYKKLYMNGYAEQDILFSNDSIKQYSLDFFHNKQTSTYGFFRTNGYYELLIDQKPLILKVVYIKTDRGIKTIITPNYDDISVSGLESFYPFDEYYQGKENKGLTFDYLSINIGFNKETFNYGLGFHFEYDVFRPALYIGPSDLKVGFGFNFF